MDYHKNARLTVSLRAELAEKVLLEGSTLKSAAAHFHVTAKTAAKWVRRYRERGHHNFAGHCPISSSLGPQPRPG